MKVIIIPNLEKYQHYKDRNIIWIKWHASCLQDHKFCQLKDNERWTFIALILLAVKNDNKIPADFHYISKQILFSSRGLPKTILKLCDLNLIAIKTLSKRYQNAIPEEKRVDKIRKEEKREDISSFKKSGFLKATGEAIRYSKGKFWVIPDDNGQWLEFTGGEKDIEFK